MNHDYRNMVDNDRIRKQYTARMIQKVVRDHKNQEHANSYRYEAQQHCAAVAAQPVFEPHARLRAGTQALAGVLFLALCGAAGLQLWPALQGEAPADWKLVVATCMVLGLGAAGVFFLHKAWRTRTHSALPPLTAEDVHKAHELRTVVGEENKLPPQGWVKVALATARLAETAAFAFVALMGLSMLPPNIGLISAVLLGLAITVSLTYLGRLHARRHKVNEGVRQYRKVFTLGEELKAVQSPLSGKYEEQADRLRAALDAAAESGFEAPGSVRLTVFWAAVIAMTGLALALRLMYGAQLGAESVVGALLLAAGSVAVFWASFKHDVQSFSVAGDAGMRAMLIAQRFPTPDVFEKAVKQHQVHTALFFDRAMGMAARVHQKLQERLDPLRPRVPLNYRLDPLPVIRVAAAASPPESSMDTTAQAIPVAPLRPTAQAAPDPTKQRPGDASPHAGVRWRWKGGTFPLSAVHSLPGAGHETR